MNHHRLLPYVGRIVAIERAQLGQRSACKLLRVDADSIEVQFYDEEGDTDSTWIYDLSTITGVCTSERAIHSLQAKISLCLTQKLED
jgi:hypothetical protein